MWREEGKGYRIPCGDSAKVSRAALSQVNQPARCSGYRASASRIA